MPILTKNQTPAKGQSAEFQLDKSALAAVSSVAADDYFKITTNWKSVYMIFKSNPAKQRIIVKFDASQATPKGYFKPSAKAKDIFQIEKIIINDFDGGEFIVKRSELTTSEFDINMGATYLWQHIFTPANNAILSGFQLTGTGQDLSDGVVLTYNQGNSTTGSLAFNTLFPEMPTGSSSSFTIRIYMEVLSGSFQNDVRLDLLNPYGGSTNPIGGYWGSVLSNGYAEVVMPAMGHFGSYKDLTVTSGSWNNSYSIKISKIQIL